MWKNGHYRNYVIKPEETHHPKLFVVVAQYGFVFLFQVQQLNMVLDLLRGILGILIPQQINLNLLVIMRFNLIQVMIVSVIRMLTMCPK